MDTTYKVESAIQSKPEGEILFPEDFAGFGPATAVHKALQRLAEKGLISRIAQGIYVRPKVNEYIGSVMPTAEDVAEAVIRRDRARTIPTGTAALHALGLSNQVPMQIVLLTDGSAREIKVGKRTIKFKKTAPRNLAAKGKISSLVIQALKTIGQIDLTPEQLEKIVSSLRSERHGDLLHDIALAPQWIKEIMQKAI